MEIPCSGLMENWTASRNGGGREPRPLGTLTPEGSRGSRGKPSSKKGFYLRLLSVSGMSSDSAGNMCMLRVIDSILSSFAIALTTSWMSVEASGPIMWNPKIL